MHLSEQTSGGQRTACESRSSSSTTQVSEIIQAVQCGGKPSYVLAIMAASRVLECKACAPRQASQARLYPLGDVYLTSLCL